MRDKLRLLVSVAIAAYLGFLLLLPLLWSKFGERHWLLIGLCYAPSILYLLPALPLIGAAALLRMKGSIPAFILMGLLIVFGRMDFQLPSRAFASGKTELSVLSYNVRAGLGGKESIASYLNGLGVDLVGLQECRQPIDTRFEDPTDTIKAAMVGYHSARGGKRGELLTLSRHPIVSSQEHDLDGYTPCLETVIDVDGRPLRFLNVHVLTGDPKSVLKGKSAARTDYLRVTAKSRRDQTAALLQVLALSELPTILVGDFNSPPSSDLHSRLSGAMQDSWNIKGLGFGLTYSASRPLWRIDYLWASPVLGVESCDVLSSKLSDHKPLAGAFRW